MRASRLITVVGCHAGGEAGNVVVGGVLAPPGQSVFERWKSHPGAENIRSYAGSTAAGAPVQYGILGGGSDFMVFLQHDGVPSLDMIFDGPYGVYHSLYDDYDWMAKYGDPGFRYHAAVSRLWGLLALRFAHADVVSLDYSPAPAQLAA